MADAAYSEALADALLAVLRAHPDGLSEHALLTALARGGEAGFDDGFRDELSLFQSHFLLFHHLYRLRDRLWAAGEGDLAIHCLCIRLSPRPVDPGAALVMTDPLRDYYLDLDQLAQTGREEVRALLDAFWRRFSACDQRTAALEGLGPADPVDDAAIRRRYRELAMEHHPDRGGEAERFHAIAAAMEVLRVAGR